MDVMTAERSAVYAIVVTHNGEAWIETCLQSLMRSRYPVQVVVVDNGSMDSTLLLVSRFPEVLLLKNEENLGFGMANNIGIRAALDRKAEWVFLLNQDASVEPETVGELVRVSLSHPRFGILSPFQLDGEGRELDARFANHLYRAGARLLSDLYLGQKREVYATTFANAAAWLVTNECLETVGGFDPLFFMYAEDDDYCNRALWHGFEIGLVPTAVVFHDRPRERSSQGGEDSRLESFEAWGYLHMQLDLMQPQGSLLLRLVSWSLANVRMGLALLGTWQWRAFLVWMLSSLRVTARLPRIWKHRRTNRHQGRHWI